MNDEGDQALRDELEAVLSIYGAENIERIAERRIAIRLARDGDGDAEGGSVQLQFTFPDQYPNAYPEVEVSGLSRADREAFASRMQHAFFETEPAGDVLVFEIAEWARRDEGLWAAVAAQRDGTTTGAGTALPADGDARCSGALWEKWIHGARICDRKSTFQAHIAHIDSCNDVGAFMDALYQDSRVRSATHNIMAYRCVRDGAEGASDFDDDGESQAGSRLLHLLRVAKVENALVVVTRHFGGIHLGPARFAHINNAARDLLQANGYIQRNNDVAAPRRPSKCKV